jgi:protein-L-isoaspartate(D-aspartate) O-methyltransferase
VVEEDSDPVQLLGQAGCGPPASREFACAKGGMSIDDRQRQPDWEELRRDMVERQLVARGIRDSNVLRAMGRLPREAFVPELQRAAAYDDCALPVGPGQTISQPYIVACMTETLQVAPGHNVLEVGGGTGYQAALLSMLGSRVISIETDAELVHRARERIELLGIRGVEFLCGDGSIGYAPAAPYERIIVTAGAPRVPPALVDQLVVGGRLVIPVGSSSQQGLVCVIKHEHGTTEYPLIACRFVRLVGEQGWQ